MIMVIYNINIFICLYNPHRSKLAKEMEQKRSTF